MTTGTLRRGRNAVLVALLVASGVAFSSPAGGTAGGGGHSSKDDSTIVIVEGKPVERIVGDEERRRTSPEMVAYDSRAAEAAIEADRRTEAAMKENKAARPIPPRLELAAPQKERRPIDPNTPVGTPGSRAPGPTASARGGAAAAGACSGNCYESNHALYTFAFPAGTYAFDYWIWNGVPQSNETNGCDGAGDPSCKWFIAGQYNMDVSGAAFHVGPYRGQGNFGNAGGDWHINISGYNAPGVGLPTGAVCSSTAPTVCVRDDEIPTAKWVRIRVWRLATTTHPLYGVMSEWGVWAMWDGVDRQMGSNLWMRGTTIASGSEWVEIYESDDQCTTDFERTYFWGPQSFNNNWSTPTKATANYQNNCSNTTWHKHGGTFIQNERQVLRTVPQGDTLWQFV